MQVGLLRNHTEQVRRLTHRVLPGDKTDGTTLCIYFFPEEIYPTGRELEIELVRSIIIPTRTWMQTSYFYTRTHTHLPKYTSKISYTHTDMWTQKHILYSNTHTHAHMHKFSHTHRHVNEKTHTHFYTETDTHAEVYIQTHTPTQTHTYMHTKTASHLL